MVLQQNLLPLSNFFYTNPIQLLYDTAVISRGGTAQMKLGNNLYHSEELNLYEFIFRYNHYQTILMSKSFHSIEADGVNLS